MTASYDYKNHAGGEDANGNPGSIYLPADSGSYAATYDVENRLVATGSSTIFYGYAPGNNRVWRGTGSFVTQYGECNTTQWSTDEVTFWGLTGQRLATFQLTESPNGYYGDCEFTASATGSNYYFGSKLLKNPSGWVYPDRLGSIGKFYPYGQERPSATTNGKEKFTGYFRDSETGNDYAMNRYSSPGFGRFITPDPSRGVFANPANPSSWNLYAYAKGDPVNNRDPFGLDDDDCYYGSDSDCGNDSDGDSFVDPFDGTGCGGTACGGTPDPDPSAPTPCAYSVCVTDTADPVPVDTTFDPILTWHVTTTVNQSGSPSQTSQASLVPGFGFLGTVDWQKLGGTVLSCAANHYGLTAAAAGAGALGLHIPKSWIGVSSTLMGGSNESTSLAGAIGLKLFGSAEPRLPIRVLGTTRVFGLAGRVAPVISGALLVWDVASIGYCTYQASQSQ